MGAVGGFNVSLTSICLVYLYTVWIGSAAVQRRGRDQPFHLGVPLLAYLLTVALSILSATVPMLAVFDLFLLAQAYALYFFIANRLKSYDDLTFIILVLAATMALQSLIIIGLASLGSSAAGQEYRYGPILFSVWPDGRIAGTLHSAVLAGSLLAILSLPVMTLNLIARTRTIWILTAIASGLGLFAILLTRTRGAILTVGLGSIVIGSGMFLRGWLPRWVLGMLVAVVLVGAYPLAVVVQKRVVGGDEGSAESRRHLTMIALETIGQRPIFGYGAGNCHIACAAVANSGKYRSEWYYTIHCKYLLVWVETGVLGFIAFLLVLGNGLRHGFLAWMTRDRLLSPLGLACAAAIGGHMLHMSVDIFNSRPQIQILWIVLGITAAIHHMSSEKSKTHGMRL